MKKYKKVVLKIGSALISESNIASSRMINDLSEQVSLMNNCIEFIIVTSGAISQGMNILNTTEKPKDLESLQALAAIGQQQLVGLYEKSFKRFDKLTAQVLLTHDDMNDHGKYMNAKATIEKLLSLKVIPIINENDVVATEEIRFGDNDILAAQLATLIGADHLILLSNVDGLYKQPPKNNMNGDLVQEVKSITKKIKDMAGTASKLGKGGMISKIKAAEICMKSKCSVIITSGLKENPIKSLGNKKTKSTKFIAK